MEASLVFANETAEHGGMSRLRHRLANGQAIENVELMRRIQSLQKVQTDGYAAADTECVARIAVDESCLAFCKSLLDHTLNGSSPDLTTYVTALR